MTVKNLQHLRDESKSHTDRATRLFQEAIKLFRLMQEASSSEEYTCRQKKWLEKDAEAREEVKKSSAAFGEFIGELERFKNRNLN